ncbi:cytochrome b/b6 domain-containing protein [Roseomonas sp. PWR1]|uniref:Cytochrome b/b6 domain-containing protein n=1 Tax=Roseomonas nitratireducens TaxID=2820810 RepID=A0ABS4AZ12_9PROT|nr:cytochrome b/b6 domain-containing protein [Neoroseomonas nitratireducens]
MSASSSDGWSRAQRWLHWGVATLVVAGFAIGLVMVALPLTRLLEKILAYQAHKTIGLLVPPLVLWRLWLRARRGRPAEEEAMPPWQRRAAAAGHAALYALLLVVPALGYLSASTAPGQIETVMFLLIPIPHVLEADEALYETLRATHQILAWALVLLAAGHAAAALHHHARGGAVLRRMWRG